MDYAALVCDVRRSRKQADWERVVDSINNTLGCANERFQDKLFMNLQLTVGDEFQGVLRDIGVAYDVYLFLKLHLPVEIYCGVGIGEVEFPLKDYAGARGTAFYRARSSLERCKKEKRGICISSQTIWDDVLNTILYLIEGIEDGWSERQREIIKFYREHPGVTYEQLGEHFGITKQGIYKVLHNARWKHVKKGEECVRMHLKFITNVGLHSIVNHI